MAFFQRFFFRSFFLRSKITYLIERVEILVSTIIIIDRRRTVSLNYTSMRNFDAFDLKTEFSRGENEISKHHTYTTRVL